MVGNMIAQVVLIVCCAIVTAAETAVPELSASWLESQAKGGGPRAARLQKLSGNPVRFLATMRLLFIFFGCLGSAWGAIRLREFLQGWLSGVQLWGGALAESLASEFAAIALGVFVFSVMMLLFGYVVPKELARSNSEKAASVCCAPAALLYTLLFPCVWLVSVISRALLGLFHIDPGRQEEVTEEEIRQLAQSSSRMGTIDSQENEFIQNIFEFNDVSVDEVCTHRKDAVCVYLEDGMEVWDRVIYENRHSFYPVCGEDTDDIVGVLDARDYLRLRERSREQVMAACVRKPYFVPENMKAASLFGNMKKTGNYFAVAIDEYGGMAGIVTMRDLLELIVGEWKEVDEEAEPEEIRSVGESVWHIRGAASLDEVEDELGLELPTDEYDTFGGYVLGLLGYVPDDGSSLTLETDALTVQVKKVEEHRILDTVVTKKERAGEA